MLIFNKGDKVVKTGDGNPILYLEEFSVDITEVLIEVVMRVNRGDTYDQLDDYITHETLIPLWDKEAILDVLDDVMEFNESNEGALYNF